MRKCRAGCPVGANINGGRLVEISRLEVDEHAPLGGAFRVSNLADREGYRVFLRFLHGHHLDRGELDLGIEVDGGKAHRACQIPEVEVLVLVRVDDQNVAAPAADHLVDAEVVEMPAVGQINVIAFGIRQSQCFGQQRLKRAGRAGLYFRLGNFCGGIGKPCAEANVEEGHQEGCCRGGIISHARTGSRP